MKHIKFSLVLSTCLGVMGLQAQKASTKANAAGASMNPSKSVVADSLVKPIGCALKASHPSGYGSQTVGKCCR